MSETKKIYMYSLDEENYHGEASDESRSISEAIIGEGLVHGSTVWISEMKLIEAPKFDEFMNVDDIFEQVDQYLADNVGIEELLFEPNDIQKNALTILLNKAWAVWIKQFPTSMRIYYSAIDPTEIEIDPEHIQIANRK